MESPTQKPQVYRFGLFEMNVLDGVLLRQGQRVKVQELPLRLLAALVEHPGEIVSRETLRERLWTENTFVEFDQSLGTALTKLRQALGDDAENPRFVETVPKRGYRFIAPVITTPSPSESLAAVTPPATSTELSPTNALANNSPVRRLAALTLVAAVLLAATAYLWTIRSSHAAPKLGEKDTVVLADFTNHTGDPTFDDTLKRALAISLAQSPVLNVFPDHQVEQTMRTMERQPGQPVTGKIALEVCQRSGSKALIAGSISTLGSRYVIALDASDCQTGAVFGQELRQAKRKEDVLDTLGEAGTSLRRRLGESLATIQRFDVPLQQATTPSLEALKSFSTAWKVRDEQGESAALPYLQHAIELDPNFAMAYGLLAQMYQQLGEDGLGASNAQKAYALRDRVTEREFFSVTNFYLNFVRGAREPALQNCRLWAAAYPQDRTARICLFFDTEMLGQTETALPYGLDCIHVDPKAAICYSDLIYVYAELHRLADAKAIYQTALSVGLDHPDLHQARYSIAFLESDSVEMARQVAWSSGKPGAESLLWSSQANTEAFYGRLQNAHSYAARAIDSANHTGEKDQAARFEIYDAFRAAMFGEFAPAKRGAADALKLSPFLFVRSLAAVALASSGDTAQAERIAGDLTAHYPDDTMLQGFWLPSIHAAIDLQRHRPEKAIEALRFAEGLERGEHIPLLPAYLRGQAYLALHDGPSAAREFKKLTEAQGILESPTLAALAPLGLAQAFAISAGSVSLTDRASYREQAIVAYTQLLAQWTNADPTLPFLLQAREELAALRKNPTTRK